MIFNYDVSDLISSSNISNLVFGIGTNIAENDNLNDYTTPGTYRCATSAVSQTLLNCPITTVNFKLLVLSGGSENYTSYVFQLILAPKSEANIDTILYVRVLNGGNWSSWYTLVTSGNVMTIGQGGTGLTSSPSVLVNLGSTSAVDILSASPRPGITGTLGLSNGGTGATSASDARDNLGLEYVKANFNASVSGGDTASITVPSSARGILVSLGVTASQDFAYLVSTTSSGSVRFGELLAPESGATVTTGTNKITIDNSGSYTMFVYWISLSGDDVTLDS